MVYINIIGIAILSVFVLFVITKKNKILSDYLLLLNIILFSGILITGILLEYKTSLINYILFLFFNSFIFPGLTIYGLVLMEKGHKFKFKWLWTAIYAFLFIAFIVIDTLVLNHIETQAEMDKLITQPSLVYNILYKGQYVFIIATLLWLILRLKNYQSNIKNFFSSIESIHLNWFKNFTYIYLWINIVSLCLFIILDLKLVEDIFVPLLIEHSILVMSLFYLCFHGIKQYNLVNIHISQNNSNVEVNSEKYATSSLSHNEMNVIFAQIEDLFKNHKIYLESELKIETIAKELELSNHKISQTINTIAKQPFYDYVNTFRVNYLKNLLVKPSNRKFTILALGIESGFNSKSSLNRIFKSQVGVSPKTYQKTHIIK